MARSRSRVRAASSRRSLDSTTTPSAAQTTPAAAAAAAAAAAEFLPAFDEAAPADAAETHDAELAATSSNVSRSSDAGPSAERRVRGDALSTNALRCFWTWAQAWARWSCSPRWRGSPSRSIGVELCMTRHARAVLARERLLACVDTAAERARCEAIELIQDDMLTSHGAVASAVSACTHVFLSSLLFNVETKHRLAEREEGAEQLVAVATLQEFPPDCRWSFVSIAAQTVQARMDWHSRAKEGSDVFIYRTGPGDVLLLILLKVESTVRSVYSHPVQSVYGLQRVPSGGLELKAEFKSSQSFTDSASLGPWLGNLRSVTVWAASLAVAMTSSAPRSRRASLRASARRQASTQDKRTERETEQ